MLRLSNWSPDSKYPKIISLQPQIHAKITQNKKQKDEQNKNPPPIDSFHKKAFSLVELIVVVAIIGILSGTAYIGIQSGKHKMYNDKILDDIIGIANALERYNHDHWGEYPVPSPDSDSNMNISCFYADATYAHDCDTSAFRQGMIDNNLLTRRYMPDVPTDPRTGSRYVYGVSTDGKYFMVGGIYEESSGNFVAKTAGNLKKGYHLPSLIRAFNGPNFVVEDGTNLPYSPDHLIITATLQNMSDSNQVTVTDGSNTVAVTDGMTIYTGYTVTTTGSTLDIYYSDGSISNLDTSSSMKILEGTEVEENDKDGIITKIRIKLTSGKIWNKVARLASASEFNVETTTAIAGVRGTEFGVDADANQVLLKSGEICRMNIGAEIPVNVVKDCTGGNVLDELIIGPTDNPKSITMDAVIGTATGDATASPDLKTLMEAQSLRYLNDNIRPHIKSVDGLEITVANYREYYSLSAGDDLDIFSLSVYELGNPDSIEDVQFATLSSEDDYSLTLASVPTAPIVLRYIGLTGPDSGDSIPITITAETSLTGEDLYGIPESVEWVDPYEEIIICDATTMVISGDATFSAGSDDTNKNVTLVWSVTPPECFDGATYSGNAGLTTSTLTLFTAVTGDMYYSLGDINNGSNYYWNVTASVGVDDYSYPASDTVLFTVPATPTWCGDGFLNGDEECDDTAMPGCIMIGADACKCNGDLGWIEKSTPDGTCVCDDTDAEITLPDYTTVPIPINSSLTWEVGPACAFEGESYAVFVGNTPSTLTFRGGGTSTSFSLTDITTPTLIPGDVYDWKISGVGVNSAVGSFEVECPSMGTISAVDVDPNGGYPIFSWVAEPACVFEEIKPTITINSVDQSVIANGDTSLEWGSLLSSGTYNYTLSSSVSADIIDNFTIAPAVIIEADLTSIVVVDAGPYNFQVLKNISTNVSDATTCTVDLSYGYVTDITGSKEFYPTNVGSSVDITCNHTLGTDIVTVVILSAARAACYGGDLMLGGGDDAGYWDGSACWVLGSAGDSCGTACPSVLGSGFICDTDLAWNDVGCSICNQFDVSASASCKDAGTSSSNPLYIIDTATTDPNYCYYRTSGDVSCTGSAAPWQRRICKCN